MSEGRFFKNASDENRVQKLEAPPNLFNKFLFILIHNFLAF